MDGGRERVRWNGAISSFLDRLHGVAQGSKAGPLLFIFVTMVNFALLKSAVGYADDTSNANPDVSGLNADSEVLVSLSKELGLVLNPAKNAVYSIWQRPRPSTSNHRRWCHNLSIRQDLHPRVHP